MKVYFHHIGKTAGTSFRKYLVGCLGETQVSPMLRGVKFQDAMREYSRYAAIGGHVEVVPGDKLPVDRVSVTFLREPLDRLLSQFFFQRSLPMLGHGGTPFRDDIERWVADLEHQRSPALNAQLDAVWAFGWADASLPGPDAAIAAAKRALERFDLVGIQDRFQQSVNLFAARLGWPLWNGSLRENVTPGRVATTDLPASVGARLRASLEPDYEVYEHALKLFGEQTGARRVMRSVADAEADAAPAPTAAADHVSRVQSLPVSRLLAADGAASSGSRTAVAPLPAPVSFVAGTDGRDDRELFIREVVVRGTVSGPGILQTGEWSTIDVQFEARVAEEQLTVGIGIRDHAEGLVHGTNTRLMGETLAVTAGVHLASFGFPNQLGLGQYSVSVALHRGASHLEKNFDHVERAADFEVVDRLGRYFEGRFQIPMQLDVQAISHGARIDAKAVEDAGVGAVIIGRRNPSLVQFAARIAARVPLTTLPRAAEALVELDLHNASEEAWPAFGKRPVRASYHWYDADGACIDFEGVRTPLPHDVIPGAGVRLLCLLRAPEAKGPMTLVWTLVQEEVAWFDERLAESRLECPVQVT